MQVQYPQNFEYCVILSNQNLVGKVWFFPNIAPCLFGWYREDVILLDYPLGRFGMLGAQWEVLVLNRYQFLWDPW